ncbi:MAG: hypothetical protein WKF84_02795 [Pyrinomonadaceae bacterium]
MIVAAAFRWRIRRQVYGAILSGALGGQCFRPEAYIWGFDNQNGAKRWSRPRAAK